MTLIYVSTDSEEAAAVIEENGKPTLHGGRVVAKSRKHKYEDISISEGALLSRDIGFNPMSRIRLSDKELAKSVSLELSRYGYFVAVFNSKSSITNLPRTSDLVDYRIFDQGFR